MRRLSRFAPTLSLILLAACGRADDTPSIVVNTGDGALTGTIGGNASEMKIDLPGFKGSVSLPKVQFDAGDFDLNGVKLYPGSRIEGVSIGDGSGNGSGGLRLSFASPAAPDVVRGWFKQRLGKAGYTLSDDGRTLSGTTDEAKPFRLELAPQGDGANGGARGTIRIGG